MQLIHKHFDYYKKSIEFLNSQLEDLHRRFPIGSYICKQTRTSLNKMNYNSILYSRIVIGKVVDYAVINGKYYASSNHMNLDEQPTAALLYRLYFTGLKEDGCWRYQAEFKDIADNACPIELRECDKKEFDIWVCRLLEQQDLVNMLETKTLTLDLIDRDDMTRIPAQRFVENLKEVIEDMKFENILLK